MSRFFGKPVHAAFVVTDVEQTIARMLESGIGPIFTMRYLRIPARYRGQRHDAVFTAAFATSGSMQYEIIQQHDDTPSPYLEFLKRNPQGGLHHMAYYSTNFNADIARVKSQGTDFQIVHEFLTPDGPPFEVYLEARNAADPLLVQLMYQGPTEPVFREMETISAAWDGKDPIRDLYAMMPPELTLPSDPPQ